MTTTHDAPAVAPGLANAATPLPGLLTAGQPEPRHLSALAAAGCRTVLDLRPPSEADRTPEEETR